MRILHQPELQQASVQFKRCLQIAIVHPAEPAGRIIRIRIVQIDDIRDVLVIDHRCGRTRQIPDKQLARRLMHRRIATPLRHVPRQRLQRRALDGDEAFLLQPLDCCIEV